MITLNFASYYDGAYGQTAHQSEVSTDGVTFHRSTLPWTLISEWVTETVDLIRICRRYQILHVAFHSNDNGCMGIRMGG